MQVSVRSYLTLGTAAVVGAGVIAMTPALPTGAARTAHLPAPAVAEVSLTGSSFSLPDVVGLLGNVDLGGLLGTVDLGELLGTVDVAEVLVGIGGLLGNVGLGNIDLGNLDLSGLLSDLANAVTREFIKQAAPVVIAAAGEVLRYAGGAVSGLVIGPDSIPVRFGSVIAEILPTVVTDLKDGGVAAGLMTLNSGLSAPMAVVTQALEDVAADINSFAADQVSTFIAAVPGLLVSAVSAVIGMNFQGLIDVIGNAISGLAGRVQPAASAPVASAPVSVADPGTEVAEQVAEPFAAPVAEPDSEPNSEPASAAVASEQHAPRAAASVRAAAAEPADEAGSPAPQDVSDETVAPATRPRAAALRPAPAGEIADGPAETTRKPAQSAGRHDARGPRAAAASRAG